MYASSNIGKLPLDREMFSRKFETSHNSVYINNNESEAEDYEKYAYMLYLRVLILHGNVLRC